MHCDALDSDIRYDSPSVHLIRFHHASTVGSDHQPGVAVPLCGGVENDRWRRQD